MSNKTLIHNISPVNIVIYAIFYYNNSSETIVLKPLIALALVNNKIQPVILGIDNKFEILPETQKYVSKYNEYYLGMLTAIDLELIKTNSSAITTEQEILRKYYKTQIEQIKENGKTRRKNNKRSVSCK